MNVTDSELKKLVQLATDYRVLYGDSIRRSKVKSPANWRKDWYFLNDLRARCGLELMLPDGKP